MIQVYFLDVGFFRVLVWFLFVVRFVSEFGGFTVLGRVGSWLAFGCVRLL